MIDNGLLIAVLLALATCIIYYLFQLERLCQVGHPAAASRQVFPPADDVLDSVDWRAVDDCKGLPAVKGVNHVVIGGNGSVGSCLVDILQKMGADSIRILDWSDPVDDLLLNPSSTDFFKCDISKEAEVNKAFARPLKLLDRPITIHHTASVIRYYERHAYVRHLSFNINVQGTKHIIQAARSLQVPVQLIYTSSVASHMDNADFMLLKGPKFNIHRDGPFNKPDSEYCQAHYNASKRAAANLVLKANGAEHFNSSQKLRTVVIRPGMGVIGPRDVFIATYLAGNINPAWAGDFVHNTICARDLARAHIFADAALRERPEKVAGESFLVTGDAEPYSYHTYRQLTQYFAGRDLHYIQVPGCDKSAFARAALHWFCHAVRYHLLVFLFGSRNVSHIPKWIGQAALLQPSLFNSPCADVLIDDSRARKELGYFHVWSKVASLKWIVETVETKRKLHQKVGKSRDGIEVLDHQSGVSAVPL